MELSDHGSDIANWVDLETNQIIKIEIQWEKGLITSITEMGPEDETLGYLIPGFIDAHVHIESAMLPPSEFGRMALRHGTVAAVADPHEIANVMGVEGINFMLEDARCSPFHAFFGAPSCVPATPFETANGRIGCEEIEMLLHQPEICCLAEMMNFPGVLNRDSGEMAKIDVAKRLGMPVDGHAPGLTGERAKRYVEAGISTDHECFSLHEAHDKMDAGMAVLIREGSAARNFETLHPLISEHPELVMFCSDDKHPDDLEQGHINQMVARAVAHGHALFDVLKCACINPINHYKLPVGQLRIGDSMDAVEVSDLTHFKPTSVWVSGQEVVRKGCLNIEKIPVKPVNNFNARHLTPEDLVVRAQGRQLRVIQVNDGELVTGEVVVSPKLESDCVVPDTPNDVLPICVINRYSPCKPALGYIRGFGLQRGAIASSVAHDSHNIIAVGADHQALCAAVNCVIEHRGGVAVAVDDSLEILPLPIAGIMSDQDGIIVAQRYASLDKKAKELGSTLEAPFMTLSFMALLVIPELKLSDKGLFDGRTFQFTDLLV